MCSNVSTLLKKDLFWLEDVLKEFEAEVKRTDEGLIILLDSARRYVWDRVSVLSLTHIEGIAANTCDVIERYLTAKYRELRFKYGFELWAKFVNINFMLIVINAIIITIKMLKRVVPKHLHEYRKTCIMQIDPSGVNKIREMEFNILKKIDFRLQLWSPFDTAVWLACAVDMPVAYRSFLAIVIDIANYNRVFLIHQLVNQQQNPTGGIPKLPTLHLAAGAVVATMMKNNIPITGVVPNLSQLVRAPNDYIKILATIIFTIL